MDHMLSVGVADASVPAPATAPTLVPARNTVKKSTRAIGKGPRDKTAAKRHRR
jgi:hypothetical protein